ncbi:MAG: NYN domain-containing protein [Gammaproteobacteria bacterium WSBS_2016_MAG_OTU1]
MKKVYIYWDNSNIFHEVQRLAEEQNGTPSARDRVHINFDNLLCLAQADREMGRLIAAGSVPPEMKQLWKRMENKGVEVELFDRIVERNGGRETPDRFLQLRMMENGINNIDTPGIVVLLTIDSDSDGAEYSKGYGFHRTLERLHKRGWQVEILSWAHACNRRMREWAEENGTFIALDDFYNSITFFESSRQGHELAPARGSAPLDLSKRAMI